MSVDTKGCVVTDNKDVFEIIHKISQEASCIWIQLSVRS